MRKFSLVLAALLIVAGGAFAQVAIEPTIEVEASATFGVQLDEMTTGIKNEAESTLSFTFTEEQTQEFGEGDVYGYIELEDFKVEFDTSGDDETTEGAVEVSVGSVTGKVMMGPVFISLDEASKEVNEAKAFALIDQSVVPYEFDLTAITFGSVKLPKVGAAVSNDPTLEYPGVALGVELPGVMTAELGIATPFDWQQDSTAVAYTANEAAAALADISKYDSDGDGTVDDPANSDAFTAANTIWAAYQSNTKKAATVDTNDKNAYMMSVKAEITALPQTTINLISTMQFGNGGNKLGEAGNPAAIGVSAEYAMPIGDMNLTPVLGFDLTTVQDAAEDQEMTMEFGLGVKLDWKSLGLDEDEDDHIDFIGNADDEEEVTSGVYLGAAFGIHSSDLVFKGDIDEKLNTLNVRFGLYEDGGDDGLLPVVGAVLMADYAMLMKNEDANLVDALTALGIGAQLSADLGVIEPYVGAKYTTYTPAVSGAGGAVEAGDANDFLAANVGVKVKEIVSNTTFTLDWASGDLLYDKDENSGNDATYGATWGAGNTSTAQLGVVTLKTKVSF